MKRSKYGWVVVVSLGFSLSYQVWASKDGELPPWLDFYTKRYQLQDTDQKLINNRGDGFEPLYGVRNFRTVLHGAYYRGGANNYYNKYGARPNMNPLPEMGLDHLCEEGFTTAVYLYEKNFETASKSKECDSIRGGKNKLTYLQIDPLTDAGAKQLLGLIRKSALGESGPIYAHCWNGWHASGVIAALSLRQFCGLTGAEGVAYWNRNIDGNDSPAFEQHRKRIREFVPDPSLTLSKEQMAELCPPAPITP